MSAPFLVGHGADWAALDSARLRDPLVEEQNDDKRRNKINTIY